MINITKLFTLSLLLSFFLPKNTYAQFKKDTFFVDFSKYYIINREITKIGENGAKNYFTIAGENPDVPGDAFSGQVGRPDGSTAFFLPGFDSLQTIANKYYYELVEKDSKPYEWVQKKSDSERRKLMHKFCIYTMEDSFAKNHMALLKDMDIYIALVPRKYLTPVKLPCGGDNGIGGGLCIHYRYTYPFTSTLYRKAAGDSFYVKLKQMVVNSEDEAYGINSKSFFFQEYLTKIAQAYSIALQDKNFHGTFINNHLLEQASEKQLNQLSRKQLHILKNAFLARRGYRFENKDLQSFFNQFEWYRTIITGKYTNDDIYLSEWEKERVRFIQNIEEAKPIN